MKQIARVQVVHRPGRWGGYKVRTITAGGRVTNAYEYHSGELDRIRRFWRAEAAKLKAEYAENL